MASLDLVPSECSIDDTVRRGGLTLAGNGGIRRMLVEVTSWDIGRVCRPSGPVQVGNGPLITIQR
jgi:hypothetical protein